MRTSSNTSNYAYIARQPIVDQSKTILGYELLYRKNGIIQRNSIPCDLEAGTKVLANMLTHFGVQSLLTEGCAFINTGFHFLTSGFLELLEPISFKVILEIQLEGYSPEQIFSTLEHLVNKGFKLALPAESLGSLYSEILDKAHYLKLDIQKLGIDSAKHIADLARKKTSLPIVAEKIETAEEYEACLELGASYFQGFFLAKPETLSRKTTYATLSNLKQLLSIVGHRTPHLIEDAARQIKNDPGLFYKLFHYAKSTSVGKLQLDSIERLIANIEHGQLERLLKLSILCSPPDQSTSPEISNIAIRTYALESLSKELNEPIKVDTLIMFTMLSELERLEDAHSTRSSLGYIEFPPEIQNALTQNKGIYNLLLRLVTAFEKNAADEITELTQQLSITPEIAQQAYNDAVKRYQVNH